MEHDRPDPRPLLAAIWATSSTTAANVARRLGLEPNRDAREYNRIRRVLSGYLYPRDAEEVGGILAAIKPDPDARAEYVAAYLSWAQFPELTRLSSAHAPVGPTPSSPSRSARAGVPAGRMGSEDDQ